MASWQSIGNIIEGGVTDFSRIIIDLKSPEEQALNHSKFLARSDTEEEVIRMNKNLEVNPFKVLEHTVHAFNENREIDRYLQFQVTPARKRHVSPKVLMNRELGNTNHFIQVKDDCYICPNMRGKGTKIRASTGNTLYIMEPPEVDKVGRIDTGHVNDGVITKTGVQYPVEDGDFESDPYRINNKPVRFGTYKGFMHKADHTHYPEGMMNSHAQVVGMNTFELQDIHTDLVPGEYTNNGGVHWNDTYIFRNGAETIVVAEEERRQFFH